MLGDTLANLKKRDYLVSRGAVMTYCTIMCLLGHSICAFSNILPNFFSPV